MTVADQGPREASNDDLQGASSQAPGRRRDERTTRRGTSKPFTCIWGKIRTQRVSRWFDGCNWDTWRARFRELFTEQGADSSTLVDPSPPEGMGYDSRARRWEEACKRTSRWLVFNLADRRGDEPDLTRSGLSTYSMIELTLAAVLTPDRAIGIIDMRSFESTAAFARKNADVTAYGVEAGING